MSKINNAKDAIHESTALLEKYHYQYNLLQAILFRIYKKHGDLEIDVAEYSDEELSGVEFGFHTLDSNGKVYQANLSSIRVAFETTPQELNRRFKDLMK